MIVQALLFVVGLVLLYFAAQALRDWRRAELGAVRAEASAPRTFFQAVAVNIVNPGPYLGWSLILGPLVIQHWANEALDAIALVVSFYVVMVLCLLGFILVIGTTGILTTQKKSFQQFVFFNFKSQH